MDIVLGAACLHSSLELLINMHTNYDYNRIHYVLINQLFWGFFKIRILLVRVSHNV